MSDPVSALQGAEFQGFVTVRDCGVQGMITLRGDLADAGLARAVKQLVGAPMPAQGMRSDGKHGAVLWMSPDELLILCGHAQAQVLADQMAAALAGQHALVANVSDARAMFAVDGPLWRDVLRKLSPADVSQTAFAEGMVRRSRIAQVAGAFWHEGTGVRIICFRSVAPFMMGLLTNAAAEGSALNL